MAYIYSMEKHSKTIVANTVLELMDFEKVLNSILEDSNINPVYFAFEKLEGQYNK